MNKIGSYSNGRWEFYRSILAIVESKMGGIGF
jgi:hypothetical protein